MEITLDNFEALVNAITVELIIENGKLMERKRLKEWMQVKEFKRYSFSLNIQLINELMDFMDLHNLGKFEDGTTPRNMMDQIGENL